MPNEDMERIVDEAVGALYADPEQPDVLTEQEIAETLTKACRGRSEGVRSATEGRIA